MSLKFYKYSANGNHFLLFDHRINPIPITKTQINKWCQLPHGIGADGVAVILKANLPEADASMVIYNSDGLEAKMCGNALRSVGHYLVNSGDAKNNQAVISTKAGLYQFKYVDEKIWVKMNQNSFHEIPNGVDVANYSRSHFINTGVPHLVLEVKNLDQIDFYHEARKYRFNPLFPEGTNVDFCEKINQDTLKLRVYERGVEDETYSCGTGIAAAALAYRSWGEWDETWKIITKGGTHFVKWEDSLWFAGNVELVFQGNIVER